VAPANDAAPADGQPAGDTFDRSLPIRATGWSESDVRREAQNIDANHDGRITDQEVAAFRQKARIAGMQDPRAATAFQKYEAGAALAAAQNKAPGRQMDKAYLDGAFARELGKAGATSDEQKDIRKTVVQQSDGKVGADVMPELQANNGLSKAQNGAVKGVLKSYGMKDAVAVDANKNGRIDADDRVVSKNDSGGVTSGKIVAPDEVNAAAGLNAVADSQAVNGKPAFMPNKPKSEWFPSKHWTYDDKSQNWRLKDGVSATEAIHYYRDHPTEFGGDCAALKQLNAQSALAEQLGPKDYDALARKEGLSIGFSAAHNSEGLSKKIITENGSWGEDPSTYPAGTMGYTHCSVPGNEAANRELQNINWSGEHFTVTTNENGEKIVMAHPFGSVPAKDFEATLKKEAAEELNRRGYSFRPEAIHLDVRPPQVYDVDKARALARAP
jgi:hypothetical protein